MAPTFNVGPGPEELEKVRDTLDILIQGGVDVTGLEVRAVGSVGVTALSNSARGW